MKLVKNLIVQVGWCLVVVGLVLWLRVVVRDSEKVWVEGGAWLAGGSLLGMWWVSMDRWIYVYWVRPGEDLSRRVRELVVGKKWWEALSELDKRRWEQVRLSTGNVLFMAMWMVVAGYILTTSESELAKGVVLGAGIKMVYEFYRDKGKKAYLVKRMFWPVNTRSGWPEAKRVMAVMVIALVVVGVMMV